MQMTAVNSLLSHMLPGFVSDWRSHDKQHPVSSWAYDMVTMICTISTSISARPSMISAVWQDSPWVRVLPWLGD